MRVLPVLILALGCLGVVSGQMGPIESLVERSPFLPPGYRPADSQRTPAPPPTVTPPASSRMEIVAVSTRNGAIHVSFRLKGQTRGVWVGPGETFEGIRFVRFDTANRQAVVENSGRREMIPLKAPSVSPMPAQTPRNPRAGAGNPPSTTSAPQTSSGPSVEVPVRRRIIVPKQ